MLGIVETFKQYEDFVSMKGADDSEIKEAEEELGLKFSNEYKDYPSVGREFGWNRGVIIMPKYKVTRYCENTKIFEAKDLEELEEVIEKGTVGAIFTEIEEEREIKVIRSNSHA